MPETTTAKETRRVVLGSGENYLKEANGTIDTSNVDELITTYFVKENLWGDTKNGAQLTYTPTTYTINDDLGRVTETVLTKEDVKLSMGLVRINDNILLPLMETARKVESAVTGRMALKVGGIANATGKSYFVGFKHLDAKRGNIYIMIIGKNDGELQLSFNPESETILNPSFVAGAMDTEGTKVIIVVDPPEPKTDATTTQPTQPTGS